MTASAIMPDWMEQRHRKPAGPGAIEIAPDEATALSLFLSMGTQWERHGMTGLRLGIRYEAVPATAQMLDVSMTPALFADLRDMELEALAAFAKDAR